MHTYIHTYIHTYMYTCLAAGALRRLRVRAEGWLLLLSKIKYYYYEVI